MARRLPCVRAKSVALVVHKMNADGREVYRYPARLLWQGAKSVTVAAVFQMPAMRVGGLLLAAGDCFVETYYRNRWYNIFAVYARSNGRLRGWYANVGEPLQVTTTAIAYRDLALDLVVLPTGQQVVLDEEEFAALGLSATARQRAWQALKALQARFGQRCTTLA